VTTTIGNAHDKAALAPAAAKETAHWCAAHLGDEDAGTERWVASAKAHYRAEWNASGRRGTLLHDAARQLVNGDPLTPVDAAGTRWPEDVIRSAEWLARFMDEWDVDPVLSERPVFHAEHRWAGTIDLVARIVGGRVLLFDYKTGRTGIYPKDAMQLAVYRHATHVQVETPDGLTDIPMPEVDGAACVWVRPDGYDVQPVRSDAGLYEVFLHMLPVSDWTTWKREATVFDPVPVPGVAAS
jgi:hypothetical protein